MTAQETLKTLAFDTSPYVVPIPAASITPISYSTPSPPIQKVPMVASSPAFSTLSSSASAPTNIKMADFGHGGVEHEEGRSDGSFDRHNGTVCVGRFGDVEQSGMGEEMSRVGSSISRERGSH